MNNSHRNLRGVEQEKADKEATEKIEEHARSLSSAGVAGSGEGVNEIHAEDLGSITSDFSVSVSLRLASVSISITVEKPIRREFMCLHIDTFEARLRATNAARSIEVSVNDLELDSYSETSVSPVMLYIIRDSESQNVPALQFIMVEDNMLENVTPHFKYIAVRMLELGVIVDSATLQLIVTDLGCDFSFMSRDQALALQDPSKWADEYNSNVLLPEKRFVMANIFLSQLAAQAPRVYIENLVLHPIKVTLTFVQTTLPRKKDDTALALAVGVLSYTPSFATVDRATLRLNSFIVYDAMESTQSLTTRILANAWRDLQFQLARLAGSLTVLGRPVGLARNIGGGVQGFFYEVKSSL